MKALKSLTTGNIPVLIHANGGRKQLANIKRTWQQLQDRHKEPKPEPQSFDEQRLKVFTWSSYEPGTTPIEISAAWWGIPITVLRPEKGVQWSNLMKTTLARNALQGVDNVWRVLFTDSDAVFNLHVLTVVSNAAAAIFNLSLLSAERGNYPEDCPAGPYEGAYQYGNSGGLMGAPVWCDMIYKLAATSYSKSVRDSDQYGVRMAVANLEALVDTEAVVFQTLAYHKDKEFEWVEL